jgi:diaminopimelate epimerase
MYRGKCRLLPGGPQQLSLPFWKVESVGNDFVLIHFDDVAAQRPHLENDETSSLSALAVAACQRRYGIGADGLLVVGRHGSGMRLRMFNPDGTEDFCGNGLRCAAWHGLRRGWVRDRFAIWHMSRTVDAWIAQDGRVSTELGCATFDPIHVPTALPSELFLEEITVLGQSFVASSVSTGSTHTVLTVPEMPPEDVFLRISQALEHDTRFPNRTSVIWCRADSERELRIRIWERGAGETLGCGTGSAAAAVVHARATGQGGTFLVENRGGPVEVDMKSWKEPIVISSRADEIFTGRLDAPPIGTFAVVDTSEVPSDCATR